MGIFLVFCTLYGANMGRSADILGVNKLAAADRSRRTSWRAESE